MGTCCLNLMQISPLGLVTAKLWDRGGDSIHLGFEISSCVQQENCHLRTRENVSDRKADGSEWAQ